MAVPSQLVYNDLDGEEVRHVLEDHFHRLLAGVSCLQRHLTLPRVKMSLQIHLDVWADQPTPERQTIVNEVEVMRPAGAAGAAEYAVLLEDTVNAAPGGQPPDKIREDHGLPVPTPVRGAIAVEDRVDGRRMEMANGAVVDRTGKAKERSKSTVVIQDFGRAGLAEGAFNRPVVERGTRDGGPVAPPVFPKREG